ncbi:MAG: DUF1501 domain-containing protein [Alphaproteobacteria bacterium]
MDRRHFMKIATCSAALTAAGPSMSFAKLPTDKRMVVIILRGGLDGLSAVVPYGDRAYSGIRSGLALADPNREGGVLALDGMFGLNPAMQPLHDMYRQKQAMFFQAVHTPYRSRSHFDAQNILEGGGSRANGTHDGWLNRTLRVWQRDPNQRLGLAVGQQVPFIMYGDTPVASWSPDNKEMAEDILDQIGRVFMRDPLFAQTFTDALRAKAMADRAIGDMRVNGNLRGGGNTQMISALGRMLGAEDGARIAVAELGGWDTHANQGTAQGALANNLRNLSTGIDTLRTSLGQDWNKTVVVVMTEFGRTVEMNGTRGSDHGTASTVMLAGGALNGGRVIADWPGLDKTRLFANRDLAPTMDIRSILKGLLVDHLGIERRDVDRHIFPGSTAAAPQRHLII